MIQHTSATEIHYPEHDGRPLSDNTKQFRLIMTIQGNLDVLVPDFVAGNLLWYPVEGRPDICMSPDVMVMLGRPKGDRRSYRQWEEGNIAPQVAFEIASPSNTRKELEDKKLKFYQRYGVEEYYVYDPDRGQLKGWLRDGNFLEAIASMEGWVSPRLGIRFETIAGELKLFSSTGEPFVTYSELMARVRQVEAQAERDRLQAEQAQMQAERDRLQAEQAQMQAERDRQRAEQAENRAAQLLARLQSLGIDPDEV